MPARQHGQGLIAGILLAAGEARRFGSNKLLQRLPDGRSIGEASGACLKSGVDIGFAVVRPADALLARTLAGVGLTIVAAPADSAEAGMGSSLACGVAAAGDAAGWVVALADMPFIQPATVAAVSAALRAGAPLAAPFYNRRRGHPVGFSAGYRDELLALTGDTGARRLLERDAARLVAVEVADPGILRDVDLPADLPRPLAGPHRDGR